MRRRPWVHNTAKRGLITLIRCGTKFWGTPQALAPRASWLLLVLLAAGSWLGACGEGAPQAPRRGKSAAGLAYEVLGSGPTVVLIHGTNLDLRMWAGEAEWLKSRARVLLYDLRGHGGSELPTEPYSNHGDLLGLLDELGEDSVDLIGLSAGAQVALDLALEAPERVRRVVLASPSLLGYVPSEMPPFLGELVAALRDGDFQAANEILIASPIMTVPAEARGRVRIMVEENEELWTLSPTLLTAISPPALDRLEAVQAPTLILIGEDDLDAIHAQGDILEERIPGSERVTIGGGGHLLNLTSPDAFRRVVSEFFGLSGGLGSSS